VGRSYFSAVYGFERNYGAELRLTQSAEVCDEDKTDAFRETVCDEMGICGGVGDYLLQPERSE
jgi:hypothetical protein